MHTLSIVVLLAAVLWLQFASSEAVKISPKLDFVESKEDSASGKGKSPKIQGVRVVVDTTKSRKSSAESKSTEDNEGTEDDDDREAAGKRKTVGIRTDITLEITEEDDDDTNKTTKTGTKKKNKDVVDEDDSEDESTGGKDRRVPVIKGSGTGGGAPKPSKPSSEESGWNIHNVPVVYGKDDGGRRKAGGDRWNARLPPYPIWTTERPPPPPAQRPHYYLTDYYGSLGPPIKSVPQSQVPWKPCRCAQQSPSQPQWKTYRPDRRTFVRPLDPHRPGSGSSSRGVDDKLEYPFTSSESEY